MWPLMVFEPPATPETPHILPYRFWYMRSSFKFLRHWKTNIHILRTFWSLKHCVIFFETVWLGGSWGVWGGPLKRVNFIFCRGDFVDGLMQDWWFQCSVVSWSGRLHHIFVGVSIIMLGVYFEAVEVKTVEILVVFLICCNFSSLQFRARTMLDKRISEVKFDAYVNQFWRKSFVVF